jgi:membrane protease YdiL (CAAX protease family)
MSQIPPLPPVPESPPTLEYDHPAHGLRRPWAISELVSWAAIVVAVAVTVLSVIQARAAGGGGAASGDPQVQMLLSSRYALGLKTMMNQVGRTGTAGVMVGADKSAMRQLLDGIEEQAKAPVDKLRAAVVRGEMEGSAAGLERMDKLEAASAGVREDVNAVRRLYAGETVDDATWKRFHERHGWFADLAAAQGKPDSDPGRTAVVNSGLRTMAGMILIVLLALAAAVTGLVLLIVGIVLMKSGKLRLAFDREVPLPRDRRAYVQGFALFLGLFVEASVILRTASAAEWLSPSLATVLGVAEMLIAVVAGALWPLFMGQRWAQWRAANGVHAGRGLLREIVCGILGYVAGFPVLVVGAIITIVLVRATGAEASHPIMKQLGGSWGTWTWMLLLASVWAPITEELMFRGALFASLRERFGWWISAPVVALVFALIHPQGWAAVPALAAIAVVFAGIREWRGSVVGCMVAHGMHNAVAVIVATMMLT